MPPLAGLAPAIGGFFSGAINLAWAGLTSLGLPGALADSVIKLAGSLLLNAAAAALFAPKMPKAQELQRELAAPTTAPAYRHVMGLSRAVGTPVGLPVRGQYIWGCWLLNSRPSALDDIALYLDKREVALDGDAFDLVGTPDGGGTGGTYGGAVATEAPFAGHVTIWIGRGDQTSPPRQFLEEAPWAEGEDEELWLPTDAWQGRTVVWARIRAGDNNKRSERWPATPPMLEITGKWSKVWDPRDNGQDPDDPDTWTWSDNHALCVLDVLRQNPIRQYRQTNLHLPSFIAAADIADEAVAVKAGGTEPRYTVAGTITYQAGEIEDQINPLVASGAGDLIRIGGRLGLAAGAWRAPEVTINDHLGMSLEATDLVDEHQLVTELRASYLSRERGYETADLQPWPIPGAQDEDGGVAAVRDLPLPFCPSPTQAMRVRKIAGLRLRRQDRLELILPPECFDLVGGATLTVAMGNAVYATFDGIYEVEAMHPGLDPVGDSGELALRIPATIVRHGPEVYDWDPETEEEEIVNEPYDGDRKGVQLPGSIETAVGDGVDLDGGGAIIARIRFSFLPSASTSVIAYEVQFREHAGDNIGSWQSGPSIGEDVRDEDDRVFGYISGVNPVLFYDIRVRAMAISGASDWVTVTNVTIGMVLTVNSATGAMGSVSMNIDTPDYANFAGVRAYRSATGQTFDDAVAVTALLPLSPGASAVDLAFGDTDAVNVLTNPGFDDGSDWSGSGWTISGGVATHTPGTATGLDQPVTGIADGATVRVGMVVSGRTAGNVSIRVIGATNVDTASVNTNGLHVFTLTAPASPATFRINPNVGFDGSVDAVFFYVPGVDAEPQGAHLYYLVPVTATGAEGAPTGAQPITIL